MAVSLYRPSWTEFRRYGDILTEKMLDDGYLPDSIVGIKRGGLTVSRIMSDILKRLSQEESGAAHPETNLYIPEFIGCSNYDQTGKKLEKPILVHELMENVEGKGVLLCDDISDTGESLDLCYSHVQGRGAAELKTATVFIREGTIFTPDYWVAHKIHDWIVFPGEEFETVVDLKLRGEEDSLRSVFTPEEIDYYWGIYQKKRKGAEVKV